LSDVAILQFPADGKIFYGTQRSRPAWDAEVGDLTEFNFGIGPCEKQTVKNAKPGFALDCVDMTAKQLASYEAMPIVLAEDSESADLTAELVDVGEGTKESDYAGKDVKGKIVLVSAQPGAVETQHFKKRREIPHCTGRPFAGANANRKRLSAPFGMTGSVDGTGYKAVC